MINATYLGHAALKPVPGRIPKLPPPAAIPGRRAESRGLNERLGNFLMVDAEDHNLVHVELHAGEFAEAKRRFKLSREWNFAHQNAYLRPYAMLDAGVIALHEG